jgi:hypothetical protein
MILPGVKNPDEGAKTSTPGRVRPTIRDIRSLPAVAGHPPAAPKRWAKAGGSPSLPFVPIYKIDSINPLLRICAMELTGIAT